MSEIENYSWAKPRKHMQTGRKAKNPSCKSALTTLAELGLNPFKEIARLAILAENKGDLVTASGNWRFLGEYVDAKRKAVDPTEIALKQKELMTLEELGEVKRLILDGDSQAPTSEKELQDSIVEQGDPPCPLV